MYLLQAGDGTAGPPVSRPSHAVDSTKYIPRRYPKHGTKPAGVRDTTNHATPCRRHRRPQPAAMLRPRLCRPLCSLVANAARVAPARRLLASSALSRAKSLPPRPKPPPDSDLEEFFVKGSGPGGQKIVRRSVSEWPPPRAEQQPCRTRPAPPSSSSTYPPASSSSPRPLAPAARTASTPVNCSRKGLTISSTATRAAAPPPARSRRGEPTAPPRKVVESIRSSTRAGPQSRTRVGTETARTCRSHPSFLPASQTVEIKPKNLDPCTFLFGRGTHHSRHRSH